MPSPSWHPTACIGHPTPCPDGAEDASRARGGRRTYGNLRVGASGAAPLEEGGGSGALCTATSRTDILVMIHVNDRGLDGPSAANAVRRSGERPPQSNTLLTHPWCLWSSQARGVEACPRANLTGWTSRTRRERGTRPRVCDLLRASGNEGTRTQRRANVRNQREISPVRHALPLARSTDRRYFLQYISNLWIACQRRVTTKQQ